MPQQRSYPQLDLSGGMQTGVSHLLRKRNEVESSKNAVYNFKIGSAKRREGYEKVARTVQHGKDSLGFDIYRYNSNYKMIVGINNSDDSLAELRMLDTADYWTTLLTATANTKFQMLNDQNELYVVGATDNNVYMPMTNVNRELNVSTSRNVYGAPRAKFITEYAGELYAINCQVNGTNYPARFYKSSPPLGAVTFVQTDQKGLLQQLRVDSVKYLKAGMVFDVYRAGTEAKIESAITIVSVDKKNNRISFAATAFDVEDNDEIWLTGTKGTLSRFWNTDYKTPETADWEQVPPGKEANPQFTAHGKNNNRLFIFTKNTFLKWDGANLITVSNSIGCVAQESVQNIGNWTIWLHHTGIWGYNDNTGDLKKLSRAVDQYIRAIKQPSIGLASAGVVDKVYKLSVGELLSFDSLTTSTSTSSTSTSSTSSSTSSTSTSSTSTSSTSTSRTTTSSSTSSTSSSTSITTTSVSSTSTSISTSTSSTSTTTLASSKEVYRLCYDFDMNTWWVETHKRDIRYQRNHDMTGYVKPYFTDDTGRVFRDEVGNLDNFDPIPMEVEFGRNNFGSDQAKSYLSVLVDSENARGALLQYSIDGGVFKTLCQITDNVEKAIFAQRGQLIEGRDINYKIVHNDSGTPPVINGLTSYFSMKEDIVNEL